jgi:hypothetical protein
MASAICGYLQRLDYVAELDFDAIRIAVVRNNLV